MDNVTLPQYSTYRLRDTAERLENFRCSIGWGQLNEDLEIAVDCLEYLTKAMREYEKSLANEIKETNKPPHWIVDDHGFAGKYYRCSVCGRGYWLGAVTDTKAADHCLHCKVDMDPDEIEYREAE